MLPFHPWALATRENTGSFYSMDQAKIDQAQSYEETIEALRRAEQKYRSIFENATEGIFQTTPEGKYLSANPALARMYGYESPAELLAHLTDISGQLYVEPDRRRKFALAMLSKPSAASLPLVIGAIAVRPFRQSAARRG